MVWHFPLFSDWGHFSQFLLVTIHDFVREKAWPELVPALKIAIENIDLMNGSEASDMKALNCLLGLQIITKPFQVRIKSFSVLGLEEEVWALSPTLLFSICVNGMVQVCP